MEIPEEWQEEDFPVSDYYKDHIVAGKTRAKSGRWWSAVLLIEHPDSGELHVGLYRWKKGDQDWKRVKNYTINSKDRLDSMVNELQKVQKLFPE